MSEQYRDDEKLQEGENLEEVTELDNSSGSEEEEGEAQTPSSKALAFHERLLSGEPRVQLTGMYEDWFWTTPPT